MEGKSLSKKAIVAIVIIAILVVAAISMVVVFLKDQGETEATAIGENNSNSEQTQDAVPENNENNNQGTATQSEEPQQEEQSEEQTTVANNDGATTNSGTTATTPVQQTTTTTDGSTQVATTTTTETIPTQALTLAWSNMTVYGGELLANLDADVTDVTAPVRLATNILKDGESNDLREYYVKRGDTIYMYIAVNEELAHNPTFTLINNGTEYVMEDSLVTVRQSAENRWDYSVRYLIPEDTAFVDGEITFKISDLVDLFGNKMTDETKPSNGNRVFFDKTPATIKLNGTEEPITIEAGSEYVDAGATVTDNIDGFISSNYQFTYANYYADPNSDKVTESRLTEIDTRKTGLYKIAYIYTDKAGNTKQATRYLYIKDTTMPTVTLNGEENITIEAGTPYKDEGAKVTDNSDPTIENFKYTNINYYVNGELKKSHLTEVDVKQPGEYKIGYEYTDKSGNTKITVRTVIVKDTTAPVITANGKSQTLKVGDTYTELGATLTDNAYIDADDYEITIHFYDENGKLVYPSPSKVDTSKVGEYRIAYTSKDSSGNASNGATISVKVER